MTAKGQIEKSGAQLGSPLYPQEVWLLALVDRAVFLFLPPQSELHVVLS